MKSKHIILLCIGLGLAGLILYRAFIIPFTHDEAATWIYLRHDHIWGCFFDPACWTSANNHWLNTVLLQWCGNIGGEQPGVLRLPNVVAGWAYILCAALMMTRYLKNTWAQLFGFLLITLHFYLLDFFSLARGYGIMVAAMLWAVYGLLRYTEMVERKWLWLTVCALFLSLLANFTAFLPVAAILGSWFIFLVVTGRYKMIIAHGMIVLSFCLTCAFLFWVPLKALSKNGEFEWGANGISEMGKDLFASLYDGAPYARITHFEPLFWYGITALIICLFALVLRRQIRTKPQVAISFLLISLVFVVIALHELITGAKAPIGRKSIFLIPLLFIPLALSQDLITRKKMAAFVGIAGSLFILFHFSSVFKQHLRSTREWYYDAYYPQLFTTLLPNGAASDSVRLGSTWLFVPALTYYQKSQALPLSGLVYQKELVIDTTMEYYFIDPSDAGRFVDSTFLLEKMIGPFMLYKKRGAPVPPPLE